MSTEREEKPDLSDVEKSQGIIPPKRESAMDAGDRAEGVASYPDPHDEKVRGHRAKTDVDVAAKDEDFKGEPLNPDPAKAETTANDPEKKPAAKKKAAPRKKAPAKKSTAKKS